MIPIAASFSLTCGLWMISPTRKQPTIGELAARLVGVVDGAIDAVAEAEFLASRKVSGPTSQPVAVGADGLDDPAGVVRRTLRLDLALEAEAAAEVGGFHGGKIQGDRRSEKGEARSVTSAGRTRPQGPRFSPLASRFSLRAAHRPRLHLQVPERPGDTDRVGGHRRLHPDGEGGGEEAALGHQLDQSILTAIPREDRGVGRPPQGTARPLGAGRLAAAMNSAGSTDIVPLARVSAAWTTMTKPVSLESPSTMATRLPGHQFTVAGSVALPLNFPFQLRAMAFVGTPPSGNAPSRPRHHQNPAPAATSSRPTADHQSASGHRVPPKIRSKRSPRPARSVIG